MVSPAAPLRGQGKGGEKEFYFSGCLRNVEQSGLFLSRYRASLLIAFELCRKIIFKCFVKERKEIYE